MTPARCPPTSHSVSMNTPPGDTRLIVILGPTAGGKSELAVGLAPTS